MPPAAGHIARPRPRRSPCLDPRAPTTCTASPSRSTPCCRPTAAWSPSASSARPSVATATATRSGSPRPTARRPRARSRSAAAPTARRGSRPTGRTLAFISDRRLLVEEEPDRPKEAKDRLDCDQIFLLPLDGGEARRLTDLPRGANELRLVARWPLARGHLELARGDDRRRRRRSAAGRAAPKPGETPLSDYRYIDRLGYQFNGAGFVDDRDAHLWLVDAATGEARSLVERPDAGGRARRGARTARGSRSRPTGGRTTTSTSDRRCSPSTSPPARVTTIAGGSDAVFVRPTWTRDGTAIVALGDRFPRVGYRCGIWRFAADGSDARPPRRHRPPRASELKPDAAHEQRHDPRRGCPRGPGRRRHDASCSRRPWTAASSCGGSPLDGSGEPVRLTSDKHYLSGWDAAPAGDRRPRRRHPLRGDDAARGGRVRGRRDGPLDEGARTVSTELNAALAAEIAWIEPVDRRWQSDGARDPGLAVSRRRRAPAARARDPRRPAHALRLRRRCSSGRSSPAPGVSVLASNPRGSEGYGEAFNRANLGDWGDGPMDDVLAGVDQAIEDGLADPDRLGVTGGSYGGYLTNWIVGKTDRFKAAITCRSVRRHADAVPHRRHLGRRVGADRVRPRPVGGRAVLRLDLAAVAREGHAHAAAHPALGARPAHDGRARPRRCSRSCARSSDRSGSCACPTRATSSPAAARRTGGRRTSSRCATGSSTTSSAGSAGSRRRRGTAPAASVPAARG